MATQGVGALRLTGISRRRALAGLLLGFVAGCGYTTRGIYPDYIQTVSVPIFKSNLMRRDIEFLLTQRVIERIESRTPFKVVSETDADTELVGEISTFVKGPFGEDGYDNPVGGAMQLIVNVSWIDKRSGKVLNERQSTFTLQAYDGFNNFLAQSITTSTDNTIDSIADQIVTLMQVPW